MSKDRARTPDQAGFDDSEHGAKAQKTGAGDNESSEDKSHSPGSGSNPLETSPKSTPTKSNVNTKDVLTLSGRYSDKSVQFTIASNREETSVKNDRGKTVQGDHVTAYVAFLEFLFNATNDKAIKDIPDQLIKTMQAILPDAKYQDQTNEIREKFEEERANYPTRERRKAITSGLRSLDSPYAEETKNSLKLAENTLIGQLIVEIGQIFLAEINQAKNIAFAKQSGATADPAEGNRVKQATYTLRLINELKRIEQIGKAAQDTTDPAKKEKLEGNFEAEKTKLLEFLAANKAAEEQEEDGRAATLRQGLRNIVENEPKMVFYKKDLEAKIMAENNTGKSEKQIKDKIKYHFNKNLKLRTNELLKSGGQQLFSLFDDKQQKADQKQTLLTQLTDVVDSQSVVVDINSLFDDGGNLKNDFSNQIQNNPLIKISFAGQDKYYQSDNSDQELKTKLQNLYEIHNGYINNEISEIIGKKFGDLFDFRQRPEIKIGLLHEVSARHLVIMFNAFDNLQSFTEAQHQTMIDIFIEKGVLVDQKWDQRESSGEKLTKEDVKEGINSFAKLQEGEYKMFTEEEREQKRSQDLQQ
jgi:hypothetical protein